MGSKSGGKSPLLIAVDGPAASGKGTIARALAQHYRLPHMDTGLLYRAVPAHYEDVLADIRSRDERDMGRAVAPLKQAPDALLLDTSELDIDQSIAEAVRLVEEVVRA